MVFFFTKDFVRLLVTTLGLSHFPHPNVVKSVLTRSPIVTEGHQPQAKVEGSASGAGTWTQARAQSSPLSPPPLPPSQVHYPWDIQPSLPHPSCLCLSRMFYHIIFIKFHFSFSFGPIIALSNMSLHRAQHSFTVRNLCLSSSRWTLSPKTLDSDE